MKLHLLLDHDGYLPTYYITSGRHARNVPLAPGSLVAMDHGYNDYTLCSSWTSNGVFFVNHLKENADSVVVEDRALPLHGNILADGLIRLIGFSAKKHCPFLLRRVVVWDTGKERNIVVFLTNHLEFGAATISAISEGRWQIELFFKALKQNLKFKTFLETTDNALYIQIWTACIAILRIMLFSLNPGSGGHSQISLPFSGGTSFNTVICGNGSIIRSMCCPLILGLRN
jgi:IS4 transposase